MPDIAKMRALLNAQVKGQGPTLDEFCPFLTERLSDPREGRPLASFCFLGEASTGKTTFVKAIAKYLEEHCHYAKRLMFDCADLRDATMQIGLRK